MTYQWPGTTTTAPAPARDSGFSPAVRASVRALGRRLCRDHPDCVTLSQCGLPRSDPDGPGLMLTEDGRMVGGGQLRACRSPMRCGWCSPMQWRLAEAKGIEYLDRHHAAGGWVVHSALTVPHRKHDSLDEVVGLLFDTWRSLPQSRVFRAAKKDAGYVAALSVLQVLWSPWSGWHPHLHVGWLCSGPSSRAEAFAGQVDRVWARQARARTDRRVSRSAAKSELVFTSLGFWKYCKTDKDPLHPKQDCRHPDHPGCPKCRPSRDPLSGDRDAGPSGPLDPNGPLDPSGPLDQRGPLEMFSQVAPAALRGDTRALAAFTEYLTSLNGARRVPSGFQWVARRYGPVDLPDPWETPGEGGTRVWFHPNLVAALELGQRSDTLTVGEIVRLAAADLVGARVAAAEQVGRPVVADTHEVDGAPILGFPDDLVVHRSTAQSQVDQLTTRSNAMRNTNPTPINNDARQGRARILGLLVDRLADDKHRAELLGAANDLEGRGRSVVASRNSANELHSAVIEFGDGDLQARWEAAIVAQIEAVEGFPARLIEMALEINDARQGKQIAPRPAAPAGDGVDEDAEEEVVAAAS